VAGSAIWAGQRATGTLNAARVRVELPVASRAGLGKRGRRCSTARRFGIVLPQKLRSQIVGGHVVYRGKRVARFRAGGKGGRFRFPAAAQGKQKLRLVLNLADGRTVTRSGTAWLCGASF
jgi:hypothetical protein